MTDQILNVPIAQEDYDTVVKALSREAAVGMSGNIPPESVETAAIQLRAYALAMARKWRKTFLDEAAMEVLEGMQAEAHTDGEPWAQPTGATDAYPQGAEVTYEDQTWVSMLPSNVWAPPRGWRPEADPEVSAAAEWVQPLDATDSYSLGATVAHDGREWESLLDANVWEPSDAVPTLWKEVTP